MTELEKSLLLLDEEFGGQGVVHDENFTTISLILGVTGGKSSRR